MELVFYAGSSLLEGPIWDQNTNTVYCVSIEQGFFDWEDEDIEKPDKFYELMDDYLNEINTNY